MTVWTPARGQPQASQGAGDASGKLEGPSGVAGSQLEGAGALEAEPL